MRRPLAFVLSGGGTRGALQVGALRALLEADIRPDLLVGTSIGAVNAAYLAVRGVNLATTEGLVEAWHDAAAADLFPSNYLWLTVRALFKRAGGLPIQRLREFFIAHGLSPDLRFADVRGVRLIIVATDLNAGSPLLYGVEPRQLVLEGLLASTALPPWVRPFEQKGHYLMDGGAVSNLPIEPAMAQGAQEIIALDLFDPRSAPVESHGFGTFLEKLVNAVQQRHAELELALAAARNVPVRHVALLGDAPVVRWDFSQTDELIARGYEITRRCIESWRTQRRSGWPRQLVRGVAKIRDGAWRRPRIANRG